MTTFLIYSALGTGLWALLLAALGGMLVQNYQLVDAYLDPIAVFVLAAMAFFAVVWVVRRRSKRKQA